MALRIKWTTRASRSFRKIVDYLEQEWGEITAKNFVIKVNEFLNLLENNPEIGVILLVNNGIRGHVISKQNTVIYRIKNDTIVLLNFFDNGQQPDKKLIH